MMKGSGSVPLTNRSGSGRQKTYRSGSGKLLVSGSDFKKNDEVDLDHNSLSIFHLRDLGTYGS
jgi:hypothetical protein